MGGTPENLNHASIRHQTNIKVKTLKKRCAKCNSQVSYEAIKCWNCGAKLASKNNSMTIMIGILVVCVFLGLALANMLSAS